MATVTSLENTVKMQNLPSFLYGCYFFLAAAIGITPVIVVWAFTAPFDPTRKILHRFTSWFAHTFYFRVNPGWRSTIEGVEHLDPSRSYILVANHQSYWDIMILHSLPIAFKWVSKKLILFIPFVGLSMLLNQYITFDRGNIRSIKNMLNSCRRWLSMGTSVAIFPEGTRSSDGNIGTFHTGAFKLSTECDVPVVPIVVDGGGSILPKGCWNMRFIADVTVHVMAPVYPSQFGYDVNKMTAYVREMMISELKNVRAAKAMANATPAIEPVAVWALPPR